MRRQPDRLPRSLVPLPGEDLLGFILRLAHRLDLTPAELFRQTALLAANRTSAPSRLMLMLDGDELTAFRSATGMSARAADQLTLRPYVNRYPPVAEALLGTRSLAARPRGLYPAWLLTTSTRYCPSCLAGDGSEIQQRHGGPWKTEWRLAMNFACPRHQTFLRTTCPNCELPSQLVQSRTRTLLSAPALGGLHPVQCRNRVGLDRVPCGARLDDIELRNREHASADLLDLQDRLLRAAPYGNPTSDPTAAHNRMADVLVLAAIVRATWPMTAHQTPSQALAQALDDDLKRPGPSSAQRLSSNDTTHWDSDPFSAQGTATLLAISASILNLPVTELRRELGQLIAEVPPRNEPAWGRTWSMLERDCSPLFRHETIQAINKRFPRPRPTQVPLPGIAGRPQHRYPPEAVPQWLPDDWMNIIAALCESRASPGSAAFRRAVAAQLVQAATDMSLSEAGAYLGIPPAWMDDWYRFRPLEERLHGRRADLPRLMRNSSATLPTGRPRTTTPGASTSRTGRCQRPTYSRSPAATPPGDDGSPPGHSEALGFTPACPPWSGPVSRAANGAWHPA